MSKPVRFDPVLARALAAELSAVLAGRGAHPAPVFAADLSATLLLDRGEALRFDLHPARGWVRIVARPPALEGRTPDARIVRVHAPDDERLLRIELHEGNRFRGGARSLVVELHTNQWNALLVDGADRRIVSLLRTRDAGGRSLRAGEVYRPPDPQRRLGARGVAEEDARARWIATLGPVAPADRRGELLRSFAWTSPLDAAFILGEAATGDDPAALHAAFHRWWEIANGAPADPVLLEADSARQPYPLPLDGVPSFRCRSLLAAFDAVAESAAEGGEERDRTVLADRARRRLEGARRRLERLQAQQSTVGHAGRLRRRADLLLANLARVQPGAERVTAFDEEGRKVRLRVDPALKPHEYAAQLYEEARRRSRAEERLPELLARAGAEIARWESAVAAAERGEPPEWLEAALARAEQRDARAAPARKAERLPYRVYRTSGGIEVRVGKTSKDNDVLTLRHAAHDDVWLHARQVPGSHVVLRWSEEGAPPARDLEEAASLAALHSKARSSGTVAVDWTRRKYVRKPRGAPPGRVLVSQAKTIFVAPDPALEERLREPDAG